MFFWDDWKGGLVYAGIFRIFFFQQSTFCVNSLAHWFVSQPYDDNHSPRDHLITALVTYGEGYHNYHHEFPSDYRNGIKLYHYDPSKWVIWTSWKLNLATGLRPFSRDAVRKGEYQQKQKRLGSAYADLNWGPLITQLPLITWEEFYSMKKQRWIAIEGFVYDIGSFEDEHLGGKAVIGAYFGKNATSSFKGGSYLRKLMFSILKGTVLK